MSQAVNMQRQRFWPVESTFLFNRPSPKEKAYVVRQTADSKYRLFESGENGSFNNDELFLCHTTSLRTADSGGVDPYRLDETDFHNTIAKTPPQVDNILEMFTKYGSLIYEMPYFLKNGILENDGTPILVYEDITRWIKLIAKMNVLMKARELHLAEKPTIEIQKLFHESKDSNHIRFCLTAFWKEGEWKYRVGWDPAVIASRDMDFNSVVNVHDNEHSFCASIRNSWEKKKELDNRQMLNALKQTIANELNAVFDNSTDEIKPYQPTRSTANMPGSLQPLATPKLVRNDENENSFLIHLKPNSLRGAAYLSFLFENTKRQRACHWCGKAMPAGSRSDKKFCSESCKSMAYKNRKRKGK